MEKSNLERAAEFIDAVEVGDGWAHYDDATRKYWVCTSAQLERLVSYLDNEDPEVRRSPYSHWCASVSSREMPDGWEPGQADEDEADNDGHVVDTACVKCECGDWSGEPCPWSGPRDETVLVRYVPGQYRGTAHALGGGIGHGLAQTLRVHENCAEWMRDHDPEWVEIVE